MKRHIAFLLIALFLLGAGSVSGAAGQVYTWKFSSWSSPKHPSVGPTQLWWKDQVEKRSKGRIQVKMYWTDELCGAKEMMIAVKSRLAEVVGHVPPLTPGETPVWGITYLPFIAPDHPYLNIIIYNRIAKESRPFIDEMDKFNCVYGGGYEADSGYNLMGRKPIRSVEDFKGLRVRVMPALGEILKQYGASPMTVPATEIYSSLSSGIVDMVAHAYFHFLAYKIEEVSKYLIKDMDMGSAPAFYFINKNAWNELPNDLKEVVQSVIEDTPGFVWQHQRRPDRLAELEKKIKERNIEIIHFPKTERAKLTSKADGVWDSWAKRTTNYELTKKGISDYLKIRDEVVSQYSQKIPTVK